MFEIPEGGDVRGVRNGSWHCRLTRTCCSAKKFTQHQLFACLVLKDFYGLSYRDVVALLADCSDLRAVMNLDRVPHFTALQPPLRPLSENLGETWDKTEGCLLSQQWV